ncbi:MAG: cation transporter [Candidatus Limivicinus sp.]|jgi:predicted Co/Zn/Cd cation transporter (cation efflux family)
MISEKKEKRILFLSFFAGLGFAIAEYIFSIFSHSQSVLMDAVYDASELIFIALILYLTPLFYKPVSEEHPYGFYQIESIFLLIKGFMMLAVTLSVSVEVIESALSGGNIVNETDISIFQFVVAVGCLIVLLIMKRMNHHLSSPTVTAELLGWKMDVLYSMGLSLAFFGASFLSRTPLAPIAPYFDQIVAVAVMLLTVPDSIRILVRAIRDVFLFPPSDEVVENIKMIATGIMTANKLRPVFFDVTRTGRHMWIDIYFQTYQDCISVRDFNRTSKQVEKALKKVYRNCSCDLILDQ